MDYVKAKFVRYNLSKNEVVQLKKFFASDSVKQDWPNRFLADGYKLTLSYDPKQNTFAAWLIQQSGSDLNIGLILSARCGSIPASIAELAWTHYYLFKKNWPREDDTEYRGWDTEE